MRAQHGGAGAIQIMINVTIKRHQTLLPALPLRNVIAKKTVVVLEQAGAGLFSRLRPNSSKAEGENKFIPASRQVDLSGECDITVLGPRVFVC
jgi:hypothetical protein